MSIFKESFQPYVFNQLKIREQILSGQTTSSIGRFGRAPVEYEGSDPTTKQKVTQKVTLNEGSFFVNTVQRQCVIKMSSGVNLDDIPENIVNEETGEEESKYAILDGGEIENEELNGSGLAKRYILYGGSYYDEVLKNEYIDEGWTSEDVITGDLQNSEINTSYENLGINNMEQRSGFLENQHILSKEGEFKMHRSSHGSAYGDPWIRADAQDGFGIVPMPGIKDMDIRTTSAYGSLRVAKVNFHCHNRRQLEILELLYMRPGFPILLEWGWAPYINNDGDRINYFRGVPDEEFYQENNNSQRIQAYIDYHKKTSNGNYDGFLGFCKNFQFKVREDGGYNCYTEIIATGEVLESLKGIRGTLTGKTRYATTFEEYLTKKTGLTRWTTSYRNSEIITGSDGLAVYQVGVSGTAYTVYEDSSNNTQEETVTDIMMGPTYETAYYQYSQKFFEDPIITNSEPVEEGDDAAASQKMINAFIEDRHLYPVDNLELYLIALEDRKMMFEFLDRWLIDQGSADAPSGGTDPNWMGGTPTPHTGDSNVDSWEGNLLLEDKLGVPGEATGESQFLTHQDYLNLASITQHVSNWTSQVINNDSYVSDDPNNTSYNDSFSQYLHWTIKGLTYGMNYLDRDDFNYGGADGIVSDQSDISQGTTGLDDEYRYIQSIPNHYSSENNYTVPESHLSHEGGNDLPSFQSPVPNHKVEIGTMGEMWEYDTTLGANEPRLRYKDAPVQAVPASFIRWDFLCEIINTLCIPNMRSKEIITEYGQPLVELVYTRDNINNRNDFEYLSYSNFILQDTSLASVDPDKYSNLGRAIDKSIDPSVCFLPTQGGMGQRIIDKGLIPKRKMDAFKNVYFGYTEWEDNEDVMEFLQNSGRAVSDSGEREQKIIFGDDYSRHQDIYNGFCPIRGMNPKNKLNSIGYIYLNIKHLRKTYKQMRYYDDGSFTDDFSLFKFLERIWDDVSRACGNLHNFKLQTVHDEPNKVRVIDTQFDGEGLTKNLFTLNIQGQNSIVRDFNYHSTIPSALSSTIAIAAQANADIDDLDKVSFAAFNNNIKSRFTKPKTEEDYAKVLDNQIESFVDNVNQLTRYFKQIERGVGWYNVSLGLEEPLVKRDAAYRHIQDIKKLTSQINSKYLDGEKKGQLLPGRKFQLAKSAIIPLKFSARLDGISGIVIGNVFDVEKQHLPKAYRQDNISFVVMSERQKVTDGQDWTTDIGGQLIIKDNGDFEQDLSIRATQGFPYTSQELDSLFGDSANADVPNANYVRAYFKFVIEEGYGELQNTGGWPHKAGEHHELSHSNIKEGGNAKFTGTLMESGDLTRSNTWPPGRDITKKMGMTLIKIFDTIFDVCGNSVKLVITNGGRDTAANRLNKDFGLSSKHGYGQAIDFKLGSWNTNHYKMITMILAKFVIDDKIRLVNEYQDKPLSAIGSDWAGLHTGHASGDHWHIQVALDTQNSKRSKCSQDENKAGQAVGCPGEGKDGAQEYLNWFNPDEYGDIDTTIPDMILPQGDDYNFYELQVALGVIDTSTPYDHIDYDNLPQSCFIAGTLVSMEDGTKKPIENIKVGDRVQGHSTVNNVLELDPVLLKNRKLYSFNDSKYFVTSDHPMLTTKGWKSLNPQNTLERDGKKVYDELKGTLEVGDILITVDGGEEELITINSKEMNDPNLPLYNLRLDGDHSYSADNYIAHNK